MHMHEMKQDGYTGPYQQDMVPVNDPGSQAAGRTGALRGLLREYRARLVPGAYYFLGTFEGSRLTGISELYVPDSRQSGAGGESVSFAFLEKGRPPEELAGKGYDFWRAQYPFSHSVASASHEFQNMLESHIRARLAHRCP